MSSKTESKKRAILTLENIGDIVFPLQKGDRIFLKGNLGAGKTTFAQALIRHFFQNPELVIPSPTYTYYQQYGDVYHFDLYRVEKPSDLVRIGADEILDNPDSICIIEWPKILNGYINPTKIIELFPLDIGREIVITNCQGV